MGTLGISTILHTVCGEVDKLQHFLWRLKGNTLNSHPCVVSSTDSTSRNAVCTLYILTFPYVSAQHQSHLFANLRLKTFKLEPQLIH